MLNQVKRIAVVGLSPRSHRPSHRVARALQGFGFTIVPVRPAVDAVLGEKAYPSLLSVPGPIDLVDVFRSSEHVAAIVDDCLRLGLQRLWLQDGVIDERAALRAQRAGMTVVMDRCILRDYTSFCLG